MNIKQLPIGLRKPPTYILTENEIESLKTDISTIKANIDNFVFNSNEVKSTCYVFDNDKIYVKGNVMPDQTSAHPRDLLSPRAVLAHEYYGHKPYLEIYWDEYLGHKSPTPIWVDEFRASYMAAKNAPNISDSDRRYLVLDALERAKEAGISIKYNDFIRSVLYGSFK